MNDVRQRLAESAAARAAAHPVTCVCRGSGRVRPPCKEGRTMIYVRIELWPRGNRERARVLGEGTIANTADAADRANFGNYNVNLMKSPEYARPQNLGQTWRRGRVVNFPRKRLGPWDLLFRALAATVGARNQEGD